MGVVVEFRCLCLVVSLVILCNAGIVNAHLAHGISHFCDLIVQVGPNLLEWFGVSWEMVMESEPETSSSDDGYVGKS